MSPASDLVAPGEYWDGVQVVGNPLFDLAAIPPRPSKEEELFTRAVVAAQSAWEAGMPITASMLHGFDEGLPVKLLAPLIVTERFVKALDARGVKVVRSGGLTPEQISALELYFTVDLPGASQLERLRAAGVSPTRWRGWMREPRFAERVQAIAEQNLRDATPVALSRVAEATDRGERWAVELQLEIAGRHDRRQAGANLGEVLQQIFAILDEEVTDPRVLARISEQVRVKMLGAPPSAPKPIALYAADADEDADDEGEQT